MSFYGFNRAALNGGVSGIIAGAALVVAASSFAAEGTRVVVPWLMESAGYVSVEASGTRTAPGASSIAVTSAASAIPSLLKLQSASVMAGSSMRATYTEAWAPSTGSLQGAGVITRPGAALAAASFYGSANPLSTVGFASQINVASSATADASVQRSGQTVWLRDGYAQAEVASSLAGVGLRTAIGYADWITLSDCTAASGKTHGGAARLDAVLSVYAVGSSDSAHFDSSSSISAAGTVTRFGVSAATAVSSLAASATLNTFGAPVELAGSTTLTASSRLALLGMANITAASSMTSVPRTALLGNALVYGSGVVQAFGLIYRHGEAVMDGMSSMTSQWSLLIESSASIVAMSTATAMPFTNAEVLDPDRRTMMRPFTDRAMTRPFTDREMRRTA